MVGRDGEQAVLVGLADLVSGGQGRVVLITGEAGVGKSCLAGWLLGACGDRGFGVFHGAADEIDRRRPFGVITDALRIREQTGGAPAEIARLLDRVSLPGQPVKGWVNPEARVVDLLTEYVRSACRARPVVIVLDDLQWADQSSLVCVARLARAVPDGCLLVCAARPYPAGRPLRALLALLASGGATQVGLGGLTSPAVVELAAAVGGGMPGKRLRRVLDQAGGNPLYVTELMACLTRESIARLSPDGVLEAIGYAGVPATVRLMIPSQLRFLPEPTVAVLRAAAVVGRGFSVSDVALIFPGGAPQATAALRPAQSAGIIITHGDRLAFRHDLVREAIYQDMAPTVCHALHRDLAAGLAAAGAGLDRVTAQVMVAADPGDTEAIGWLRAAAAAISCTAPVIAADLLERALQLAGGAGGSRRVILADLVRPLLWTGQAARAEQVCEQGLATTGEDEPLFWLGRADARMLQGRFQEARAACREAMGRAGRPGRRRPVAPGRAVRAGWGVPGRG